MKHDSLISIIPWLPFLALTQRCFSSHVLLVSAGDFALHSLCLYLDTPCPHLPSFRLAQAIFELNLFPYRYKNNVIPVILPAYTAHEGGTECSKTSEYKNQMLGNRPKEKYEYISVLQYWGGSYTLTGGYQGCSFNSPTLSIALLTYSHRNAGHSNSHAKHHNITL